MLRSAPVAKLNLVVAYRRIRRMAPLSRAAAAKVAVNIKRMSLVVSEELRVV